MDLVEGIGRANSRKQSTNPNTPSFRKKNQKTIFENSDCEICVLETFSKICVLEKYVFSKNFFEKCWCVLEKYQFFSKTQSHTKNRNYTISKFSQKSKYFLSCTRERIPIIQLWTWKGTAASNLESVTKSVFET